MTTQVALITGASRGLGLEVARAYARRGLRLILTARGADGAASRRPTSLAASPRWWPAGDVGNPPHAERLVAAGLSKFGQIDVLINNASELGPSPMPDLEHLPIEASSDILRVNVVGAAQADPAGAAWHARAELRTDRQRDLRRRCAGVPDLGRLRREQSRAGAPVARAGGGVGGQRCAGLRRRSGRHGYGHAPGRRAGRRSVAPAEPGCGRAGVRATAGRAAAFGRFEAQRLRRRRRT